MPDCQHNVSLVHERHLTNDDEKVGCEQGMEPASAVLAAAAAKDTTLSTLSKLLSPPELGDGERSESDADEAEANLEPYAAEQMPVATPSMATEQAQNNAAPLTEEQRRLQALVQSTVLPRRQVLPAPEHLVHL